MDQAAIAWQDYARDSGTPHAGAKLPEDLLKEIERNRASMPAEPDLSTTPGASSASSEQALKRAPLAGKPDLEAVARGRGALRVGARGDSVKAVQEALIKLGFAVPGGADGAFGKGLEGAIKAFQTSRKLADDGIIGPGTLRAIDAALGA